MEERDASAPDLRAITSQLEVLTGQMRVLVSRVETRIPMVDGFDDRLARAESLEKSLASTILKIAGARAMASWIPGAVAGAIAGASAAWVVLHSAMALAR